MLIHRHAGTSFADVASSNAFSLPPARACITPEGYLRLEAEISRLVRTVRPAVAAAVAESTRAHGMGDHSCAKRQVQDLDARIENLSRRLAAVTIIDPAKQTRRDRVFFGATVTFATEVGEIRTVTLLGADEIVADQGQVSWSAPLAQALAGHEVGDSVVARTPSGSTTIEILSISYPGKPAGDRDRTQGLN